VKEGQFDALLETAGAQQRVDVADQTNYWITVPPARSNWALLESDRWATCSTWYRRPSSTGNATW